MLACAFVLYTSLTTPGTKNILLFVLMFTLGLLVFGWRLWRLRGPQATFYEDRLEIPGLFKPAILHRGNILGVGAASSTRLGASFEIASRSEREPGLRLPEAFRRDAIVAEWLRGAPDPQVESVTADRAHILADPRYGSTEAERAGRFERTRQWVLVFNLACLALAGVVGLVTRFDLLALVFAVAPIAIAAAMVARSDGMVIWAGRARARPVVVGATAPTLALAARAWLTVHLLAVQPVMLIAVAVGLGVATLTFWRRSGLAMRVQTAISLGLISGIVAYGGVVAIDVGLDTSPPRAFVTHVTGRRSSQGRSTTYHLALGPWADRAAGEVSVAASIYAEAHIGSRVCIARHSGGLGLSWFDVRLCAAAPESAGEISDQASQVIVSGRVRTPTSDELSELYPERALRLERGGKATVTCAVRANGTVTDCRVVSEYPTGLGFGAAALKAAGRFRMEPQIIDGRPVDNGTITIPLRWETARP